MVKSQRDSKPIDYESPQLNSDRKQIICKELNNDIQNIVDSLTYNKLILTPS